MAMLKRKGDDWIRSPADIAGKPIGSQAGSAQLHALQVDAKKLADDGTRVGDIATYVDFCEAYADPPSAGLPASSTACRT